MGADAQHLEIRQHIRFNAFQAGLCFFQAVRFNAKGDVLGLCQAVVPPGKLAFEHPRIFPPDAVKCVRLLRDMDGLLVFLHIRPLVEKRKLYFDGTVKIVEEIAVVLKNQVLVLVLCKLVVHIVKLDLLGEIAVANDADTVPAHFLVGDGLLGGLGEPAVPLCLADRCRKPPFVPAAQFRVRGQAQGGL